MHFYSQMFDITIDVLSLGVEFLPSKATVDDVWGEGSGHACYCE